MPELETNLGQIYISNKKLSKSFVCLLSEKLSGSNSEIYTLIETPILNNQAWPEYERTTKILQGILRKNFLAPNPNAFENSIAEINDYLSRLAAKGQAAWIGKINGCVAARQSDRLFVSSAGKIHAYLLRDKQFSDIADSPKTTNPLKVFENFATGKITKKDFVILTTNQLFNFISIERLRENLLKDSLEIASRAIADIVTETADSTISFATLVIELGEQGSFANQQNMPADPVLVVTNKFTKLGARSINETTKKAAAIFSKLKYALFNLRAPNFSLKDLSPVLLAARAKEMANINKIKEFPKIKKFFLISAGIFIIVLLINVVVALNLRSHRIKTQNTAKAFQSVTDKINDANSAFIYNDKASAIQSLQSAKSDLAKIVKNKETEQKINEFSTEIASLENTINGLKNANVQELATNSKGNADRLLLLGSQIYLINNKANFIIPFDPASKHFGAEITIAGAPEAKAIAGTENGIYFIDQSGSLFQIDLNSKSAVNQNNNLGAGNSAIALYGSPAKVYAVNKHQNTILSAATAGNIETKRYLKQNDELSQALDIAIDGSVYVLTSNDIKKYNLGISQGFLSAAMNFSEQAKIKTAPNLNSVYVLDPGRKLLILFDKKGQIKNQYISEQFSAAKDFAVSADGKAAYLLIDQKIVKIVF